MSVESHSRLKSATTLPCRSCGFAIPFVVKLGRYDLGCPECATRTLVEVALERRTVRIKPIPR